MATESQFVEHLPCEACGSSDAKSSYSDGHAFCFSCNTYFKAEGIAEIEVIDSNLVKGTYDHLTKRGISVDTCKKYGYMQGHYDGKPVQIANYYKNGKIIAQKLRTADKDFFFLGNPKDAGLFGDHVWGSGKRLVITEGEIDALSVSQAMNNTWPVVSVKNGASGALKNIKENLNYFNLFEEIVILFDQDEPGQTAAHEVAQILPIGKTYIASIPLKDANEMLIAGKVDELVNSIWRAKLYRPDGVISGDELLERVLNKKFTSDFSYPWPVLQNLTKGCRKGEIVLITSGTGMGKSSFIREISLNLLRENKKVGFIALEESVDYTALNLIGLELNKRIHLDQSTVNNNEIKDTFNKLLGKNAYFYDHFGSLDEDRLTEVIRYMAIGFGVEWIVLDHISMACSGANASEERAIIDTVMTNLRKVVQELNIGIFIISHLRRLHGDKGHEDGVEVSLSHLRGSGSLGQIPNIIITLEGNMVGNNPTLRKLKVLKNRFSGDVGSADQIVYDKQTGRLVTYNHIHPNNNDDF